MNAVPFRHGSRYLGFSGSSSIWNIWWSISWNITETYSAYGAKQASPHRWQTFDSADNAAGEGLLELEVLSISGECMLTLNVVRLHAVVVICGSWFWTKIPAKPGLQLVVIPQYFKACAEWKSETARASGSPGTGFGYLHARQFACCLALCPRSTALRTKSSHWMGLQKWQWLPCMSQHACLAAAICPRAFAPWHLHLSFHQELDNVRLPPGLQSLTFGARFNQSLDNASWPVGLRTLTFGRNFDQSLDKVTWPAGLQSLTFGWRFRSEPGQSDMASRPAKPVTFGDEFQSEAWIMWHGQQACKVWLLDGRFNQNLDNVTWPAGLQSLTFGYEFNPEPGQCDMASRPSKFDFWCIFSIKALTTWHGQQVFRAWPLLGRFESEPGQCDMASEAFKVWLLMLKFRSEPR